MIAEHTPNGYAHSRVTLRRDMWKGLGAQHNQRSNPHLHLCPACVQHVFRQRGEQSGVGNLVIVGHVNLVSTEVETPEKVKSMRIAFFNNHVCALCWLELPV